MHGVNSSCIFQVCGVEIPKDTGIQIPVWEIHRDPDQWSNPEEFDPER